MIHIKINYQICFTLYFQVSNSILTHFLTTVARVYGQLLDHLKGVCQMVALLPLPAVVQLHPTSITCSITRHSAAICRLLVSFHSNRGCINLCTCGKSPNAKCWHKCNVNCILKKDIFRSQISSEVYNFIIKNIVLIVSKLPSMQKAYSQYMHEKMGYLSFINSI